MQSYFMKIFISDTINKNEIDWTEPWQSSFDVTIALFFALYNVDSFYIITT